jgi:diguanylate cyclase (GGDEF)-like protein/putative nucleotidyltransferase with HDIG domain
LAQAADLPARPNGTPAVVESYRKLADVFHEVLSEQTLDDLLERVAGTLDELIPNDGLTFYEADLPARTLAAVFAIGTDAEKVLADDPFPFGAGITGWAAEHVTPVLANEAHLDPRVRWVADTDAAPESLIVVPLVARGALKGTLNIYRDGVRVFTEDEYELAKRYADAAALAIDNAHIRATLEHQAQTDGLTGLWNHRAFHERLRHELLRASSDHAQVGLVILDLDDFKRVNDVFGHGVGDQVLTELGDILRGAVRTTDAVCRIGGEEFAIILPGGTLETAVGLAERLGRTVESTTFEPVGPMTVSVGVAIGPAHAANPRELAACAEVAMMAAKARGKRRVVVFDDGDRERPVVHDGSSRDELRSIAHLKMLHGVSSKLTRLNGVPEIGQTIADELRLLIDYHNCRVFLRDGDDLRPIAFRGELSGHGSAMELLATKVGVGITGHVAATGAPMLTGDAANCDIGQPIDGTETIEESLLAVPLKYGPQVVGVIVVSKLGLDQFDSDDVRLLEVLAGHASVALMNAQLYDVQRREAESAKLLLELSRDVSSTTDLAEVLDRLARGAATILGSPKASLWLPSDDGALECRALHLAPGCVTAAHVGLRLPGVTADDLAGVTEPYVLTREQAEEIVSPDLLDATSQAFAVAPVPAGLGCGALTVAVPDPGGFGERQLALLAGIASQARLAIANAESFHTLERTFLSTIEALVNALEANDAYTSSHARSIRDMAVAVATELGLDATAVKRAELGALFHDIGKIGVPTHILMKPGRLTPEERAVIERHPELGERILEPIEQLRDVRRIVRSCHERWDGRGYPDGLREDEIPLEARIIFVCDAFHAMTTDRPYRSALSVDEACRRLADAAGTQFDPRVAAVCIRLFGNGWIERGR